MMVTVTIPEELRGHCRLFVNGREVELPADVASIEVTSVGGGGPGRAVAIGAGGGGGSAGGVTAFGGPGHDRKG